MRNLFEVERQTQYLRTTPLLIERVDGGIIHPLESPRSGPGLSTMYGGVTDGELHFIPLSLTKRVSPPNFLCEQEDWFCGANPKLASPNLHCDQDVVFLGALSAHYGHFILEGLSRLWPYLESGNQNFKAAYISEHGDCRFLDFFILFGLRPEQLLRVDSPTKFKTVIIPEQSIRLHDFYHPYYKKIIDKIKSAVAPKLSAAPKKIFFSKRDSNSNRAGGESYIENVFSSAGYSIFSPERMGAYETISLLSGCEEFVASSGTNAHNSIFLPDGAQVVCINRSAHFHPIQSMIDRMKKLSTTYIDAYFWSSIVNFGDSPCFLAPTKYLFQYFNYRNFVYSKRELIKYLPRGLLLHLRAKIRWYVRGGLRYVYKKLVLSNFKPLNLIADKIKSIYP